MLGEMFFKDNDDDNDDLEEYTEDTEHLPYQVILKNENYEQRYFLLLSLSATPPRTLTLPGIHLMVLTR